MSGRELSRRQKNIAVTASGKARGAQILKSLSERYATHGKSNQQFKPEMTEFVLQEVTRGRDVWDIARELEINNGLINQRAYDDPEFHDRLLRAKEHGAYARFDYLMAVAMDFSLPVQDRKLIMKAIELMCKFYNRNFFGDEIKVSSSNSLSVSLSMGDLALAGPIDMTALSDLTSVPLNAIDAIVLEPETITVEPKDPDT